MSKTTKRYDRTTREGAEHLLRTFRRILDVLGLTDERAVHYREIEAADISCNSIAFGIGVTLNVRLKAQEGSWARFDFNLGWPSSSGSPGDAIAQATLIRRLAERAAIAQCIAREHGTEWTSAEIQQAIDTLHEGGEKTPKDRPQDVAIDVPETVDKLVTAVGLIVEALPVSDQSGTAADFIVNHLGDDEIRPWDDIEEETT